MKYPLTKKHCKILDKRPKNDNSSTNIHKIKRNRKRQIIWFNPPFNLQTKTKIGKLFLNLQKLANYSTSNCIGLFNRTNVKISYSCMPNMNSYTYVHDHKVLNDKPNKPGMNNCDCRNKDTCSLPNSFQMKWIIYQANIDYGIAEQKQKCYLGSCKTTLKIVSGIKKSRSTTLHIKMIRNYQKNFGKPKRAMEHQKLHGKLSEYAVLTIQTVSTAFPLKLADTEVSTNLPIVKL